MVILCPDIIEEGSHEGSEASTHSWKLTEAKGYKISCEKKSLSYKTQPVHSEDSEHLLDSQKIPCIEIMEHKNVKEIALPMKPRQLQELQKK